MLEAKRKAIIFLSVAFVFALISGLLFTNYVKSVNVKMGTMTYYYVAKKDIAPRIPLKAEDFEAIEIPQRFLPANLVTDPQSINGAVTVVPLAAGDAIEKNMLKPVTYSAKGSNSRLVRIMGTDRILFDSTLEAMDRVDIIVSHRNKDKPTAEVFMRDVPVATIYEGKPQSASGKVIDDAPTQMLGIGVDVTLEEARRLIEMVNYADSVRVLKANVTGDSQKNKEESNTEKTNQGE